MVQDRTVLTSGRRHLRASYLFPLLLSILLTAVSVGKGQNLAKDKIRHNLSLGFTVTEHEFFGGYGLGIGYRRNQLESGAHLELNNYSYGTSVYGRYYLTKTRRKYDTFAGIKGAYIYNTTNLNLLPSYSWSLHASIGLRLQLYHNLWLQGQLGAGYSGFFRPGGTPFFKPAWVPLRMIQGGLNYDIALGNQGTRDAEVLPLQGKPNFADRFSLIFHTGIQINRFAPPSLERFTGGFGFDVLPSLTLTARHQAVRTVDGLVYGKSLLGVRWMPGKGKGMRWVGGFEMGHYGPDVNSQSYQYAIGATFSQHLQYPITRWLALDAGFQYSKIKVPEPLNPASSDFEINLGLVFRPGRFR
jgi:hypothetical protein